MSLERKTTRPGFWLTNEKTTRFILNKSLVLSTLRGGRISSRLRHSGDKVVRARLFFMAKIKTKNMPTGYGMVQTAVMKMRGLSRNAKAIYALLASYTGSSEFCWPSQRTIANDMGFKKAETVSRYIAELEGCRLIEKSRLYPGDETKRNLKYRINIIETAGLHSPLHRGDMLVPPPSTRETSPLQMVVRPPQGVMQNSIKINNILSNNNGKTAEELDKEFEELFGGEDDSKRETS